MNERRFRPPRDDGSCRANQHYSNEPDEHLPHVEALCREPLAQVQGLRHEPLPQVQGLRLEGLAGVSWSTPPGTPNAIQEAYRAVQEDIMPEEWERWEPPASLVSVETSTSGSATIIIRGLNKDTKRHEIGDMMDDAAEVLFKHVVKVFKR